MILGMVLAAAGCGTLTEKHGVANTRGDETIEVVMPADAPSIWRGFHPPAADPQKEPPADHFGLDILAPVGTEVLAPAPGVVARSYFEPMYGNRVDLEHGPDQAGRRVVTRFLHLKTRLVEPGQQVQRGQVIGQLGRSGLLAGGMAHLHFEVHRQDPAGRMQPVDPHLYWAAGIGRVTCFEPGAARPDTPLRLTYPLPCGLP